MYSTSLWHFGKLKQTAREPLSKDANRDRGTTVVLFSPCVVDIGYSNTSACPTLFSKGSHAFSSVFSFSAASKIIALAPCEHCIIFNSCTKAYEALSSTQPVYLNSMLNPARNSRQLRSTSSNPLYILRVKTGTRAFSVAAPTVWNSLPASVNSEGNIVSFRRRLRTYLFNAAYPL